MARGGCRGSLGRLRVAHEMVSDSSTGRPEAVFCVFYDIAMW